MDDIKITCAYTELKNPKDLLPFPKKPNKHTDAQIERLCLLIKHYGFRHPIIVSKNSGFIIAGHGRWQAAMKLKLESVPVDYQEFKNPDDEYGFVVSDNSISDWSELDLSMINSEMINLGPDFDVDLLGLEDFELEIADKIEPKCDEDDAVEPPKNPKTVLGDLYELGKHKLICGSAVEINYYEKLLSKEIANMVWTDPPYNVAYTGKTKDAMTIVNDEMKDEDFYKFLYDFYSNAIMFTRQGGSIYVAHADSEGANFRSAMNKSGWLLKQCLVWVKSTLVMGRQDYHWKHEPILYGWKPGDSHKWFSDRKQTTVLEFDKPNRNGEHPTMKPVDLIEYCINNSCENDGIVLDPFGGSGSTLIACEKNNKRSALIELDPKYCDVIVSRYVKYTGNNKIKRNGEEIIWEV